MPELDELEIFDEQGNALSIDDLPVGTTIEGPDGEELVVVEGDPDPAYVEEPDAQFEPEFDTVGKAVGTNFVRGVKAGYGGWNPGTGRAGQAGAHLGRNRKKYMVGAGATTVAGGAAYGGKKYMDGREETSKSLGDALLEHLSKADADERTQILAKSMATEIEKAQEQADQAMEYAYQLEDERITEAFISKAAEYNLPVDPTDFGLILKSAASVLTDEQLDTLDQLFTSIGEFLYQEVGAVGDTDNVDVMSQVDAYAQELVGKSAGLTGAEAQVMLFEQNPDAYAMYLSENGGR